MAATSIFKVTRKGNGPFSTSPVRSYPGGREGVHMAWKLAPVVAAVAALLPGVGYSLGLGNILVHSGLNQSLRAEIEVLAEDRKDLAGLNVRLAGAPDFQRAGLDRPLVLSRLRFEVTHRANGSTMIAVRSTEPVKEPFLNFLLEINWPSGRLLREYAVLLDPPRLLTRTSPRQLSFTEPEESRADNQKPEPPEEGRNPLAQTLPNHYGPVRRDETLWRIAGTLRSDASLSNQQIMMALLKANPENFEEGNLNGLKAGSVLRVPSVEQMRALTREEAVAELIHHRQLWREHHSRSVTPPQTAAALPPQAKATTKPARNARPDAGPIRNTRPGSDTSLPSETTAELRLVSPSQKDKEPGQPARSGAKNENGKVGSDDTVGVTALRQQIDLVQEVAHTNQHESEEMRARLADLERQINGMQQVLRVKDENLAALQAQLAHHTPGSPPAAVQPDVAPSNSVPLPTTPTVVASVSIAAGTSTPAAGVTPAQPATAPSTPIQSPATPLTSSALLKPPSDPPDLPSSGSSGSLLDSFLSDPTLIGLTTALLGAIGLLGTLLVRRRRAATVTALPGISIDLDVPVQPKVEPISPLPRTSAGKPVGTAVPQPPRNEIPAQPKPSRGQETSRTGDPLTEAEFYLTHGRYQQATDLITEVEFYLTHGRYQQATDLIQQVIAQEPNRTDLRLKMLEVHFATKDRPAFIEQAQYLRGLLAGRDDHPLWQKALSMGRELAPGHALFAGIPLAISPGSTGTVIMDANSLRGATSPAKPSDTFAATQVGMSTQVGLMPGIEAELGESGQTIEFDLGFLDSLDELDGMDGLDQEPEPPAPPSPPVFTPTPPAPITLRSMVPPPATAVLPPVATVRSAPTVALPATSNVNADMGFEDLFADLDMGATTPPMPGFTATTATLPLTALPADELDMSLSWETPQASAPGLAVEPSDRPPVADSDLTWDALKANQVSIDLNESMEFDLMEMGEFSGFPGLKESATLSAVDHTTAVPIPTPTEIPFPTLDLLSSGEKEQGKGTTLPGNVPKKAISTPVSLEGSLTFDLMGLEEPLDFMEEEGQPQASRGSDSSVATEVGEELGDEIATKLDLAQAYLDLGNQEGAQEILQEVIQEGNPAQRRMAEALLAKIN
ncbi:pilus assembly protein FimV [Gammaproteobacteria bacterium]